MNREPINKQNLSDAVAEKLREYIRSSDAPRSLKLPPEAVIGESMGASRITVRRALSDLEQEGLIQAHPWARHLYQSQYLQNQGHHHPWAGSAPAHPGKRLRIPQ